MVQGVSPEGGGWGVRNEGWTLADLAGELLARGIDINDVPDGQISRTLECPEPELPAKQIVDGGGQGE
jgi:hypothetical protein